MLIESAGKSIGTREGTQQTWDGQWARSSFADEAHSLEYPRWTEVLNAITPHLEPHQATLEAGCGMGHIVQYLQGRGFAVLGIDYAWNGVSKGKTTDEALCLCLGDLHELPLPDRALGAYLSFGVLEHFEEGPMPALMEAYRVLKSGGHLCLTIPHQNFGEQASPYVRRFLELLRLEPLRRNNALRSLFRKGVVVRPGRIAVSIPFYEVRYSHGQVRAFVERAGFNVLSMKPVGHGFSWYLLAPFFRKKGAYYETTGLCEIWAKIFKLFWPWATCFSTLLIARKP